MWRLGWILFCLCSLVGDLRAELFVTTDGARISGELVGFEGGCYVVQIGRFQKRLPEDRVKEILDADGSAPADPSSSPSSSPSLSPSANPYDGPSSRPPRQRNAPGNLDPAAFQRMLEAAGMGNGMGNGDGNQRSRPGGRLPVSAETEALLKQAVDMKNDNPLMRSGGDPQALEGLKNNPSMGSMVDRFRNKDFQKRLLDELRQMNENLNPGQANPNMDMLEQLFQQLNGGGEDEP